MWSLVPLWFHVITRWFKMFTLVVFLSQSASNFVVSLLRCVFDYFSRFQVSLPIQPTLKWFTYFKNLTLKSLLFIHFHRIQSLKISEFSRILYTHVQTNRIWSLLIESSPFFMFFFPFFWFSILWWVYKISLGIRRRMGGIKQGVDPCRVKMLTESFWSKKSAVFVLIVV